MFFVWILDISAAPLRFFESQCRRRGYRAVSEFSIRVMISLPLPCQCSTLCKHLTFFARLLTPRMASCAIALIESSSDSARFGPVSCATTGGRAANYALIFNQSSILVPAQPIVRSLLRVSHQICSFEYFPFMLLKNGQGRPLFSFLVLLSLLLDLRSPSNCFIRFFFQQRFLGH